jgi:hypothetical protein
VSSLANVIVVALASAVGLWLLSFVVEAARPTPATPKSLPWAPGVAVHFADLGGYTVRYIRAGDGPTLLLLHTLRTQLDLFEKVVPELANHFTVYAFDYPRAAAQSSLLRAGREARRGKEVKQTSDSSVVSAGAPGSYQLRARA